MEKNYGSKDKTMVLYFELWNFDLRKETPWQIICNQKLRNFDLKSKENYDNIPKQLKFLNLQLQNFDAVWKTRVQWEKMCYHTENYGTILKTMEICFTIENNCVLLWKKLWNYS